MASRFEPNPAGLKAILATPAMVEAMRQLAERVEVEAVRIAPVRTGHYVNSFDFEADVHEGVARGVVRNSASYARFLEWGTSHMHKQRILGRALDALNLA